MNTHPIFLLPECFLLLVNLLLDLHLNSIARRLIGLGTITRALEKLDLVTWDTQCVMHDQLTCYTNYFVEELVCNDVSNCS